MWPKNLIHKQIKSLKLECDLIWEKLWWFLSMLLGQVDSGNPNAKVKLQLKLQLKQYILGGISENLIPKAQGL